MSLVIAGNSGNITTPINNTIVGLANNGAGAIRAQTSGPHFYGDQNFVHVITTGGVIFDGYFTIIVVDATHFDLVGSTYTGTGTGSVRGLSLTPNIRVPTDGDEASLQLSGMLSALQALADRTQSVQKSAVEQTIVTLDLAVSGTYPIPPWTNWLLIISCGGGGGGGGGLGGIASPGGNYPAGGGGAGAEFCEFFTTVDPSTAPTITVAIGAGGAGGAGSSIYSTPSTPGTRGSPTTITSATLPVHTFRGGEGGGGSNDDIIAPTTGSGDDNWPSFVPGGKGAFRRGGPTTVSRTSPAPQQMIDIVNHGGTLSVNIGGSGNWPTSLYVDPVGFMEFSEGGASVANGSSTVYAAAVSYVGALSRTGFAGGGTLSKGGDDGSYIGGCNGGGGGGGAFGPGGVGGVGGNANASGTASAGGAGFTPSGWGGGGGGGGGGGNGTTGGHGGNGATGAPGRMFVLCIP